MSDFRAGDKGIQVDYSFIKSHPIKAVQEYSATQLLHEWWNLLSNLNRLERIQREHGKILLKYKAKSE